MAADTLKTAQKRTAPATAPGGRAMAPGRTLAQLADKLAGGPGVRTVQALGARLGPARPLPGGPVVQRVLRIAGPAEGPALDTARENLREAYRAGMPQGANGDLIFAPLGNNAWGQPEFEVQEQQQPAQDWQGSTLVGGLIRSAQTTNVYAGEGDNDASPSNVDAAIAGQVSGSMVRLTEGATPIEMIHELIHAHHNQDAAAVLPLAEREQQIPYPDPDNPGQDLTERREEVRTVGLGAHQNDPLTENAFRAVMGLPQRTRY